MGDRVRQILRDIELGNGSDDWKELPFNEVVNNISKFYALAEAFKEYAELRGDPEIADALDKILY